MSKPEVGCQPIRFDQSSSPLSLLGRWFAWCWVQLCLVKLCFLALFRLDPARFRNIQFRPWVIKMMEGVNYWYLIPKTLRLKRPIETERFKQQLKRLSRELPILIVANHTSYTDIHGTFHPLEKAFRPRPVWMAGIEPFDFAGGFYGFVMQSCGSFSIDRGMLDVRSTQVAQGVLSNNTHPLVIFPEGEADYTHHQLRPFFDGVSLFAMNALKQQPTVQILPMVIRYTLPTFPAEGIVLACQQLIDKRLDQPSCQVLPVVLPKQCQMAEALQLTMDFVVADLETQFFQPDEWTGLKQRSLPERFAGLRQAILKTLCQDHSEIQCPSLEALSFAETVKLKNQFHSLVARKYRALSTKEIRLASKVLQTVEQWAVRTPQLSLKWLEVSVKCLESLYFGLEYQDDGLNIRIERLKEHFINRTILAELKERQSTETLLRWQQQLTYARKIKMLLLLEEDFDVLSHSLSVEAADDFLIKLEILCLNKMVYRGPKAMTLDAGEIMDLAEMLENWAEQPRKIKIKNVTETMRATIQSLLS